MANKLIWGSDLYKGWKEPRNAFAGNSLTDIQPFQMLTMEEKSIDWIKAVADYYDIAGWNNVERKAGRIQRNYMMRHGKLNPNDYIINADPGVLASTVGMFIPQAESPLEQFYSLAPRFVDVMRGEFIKREHTWTIEAIDATSTAEVFREKEDQFRSIVLENSALIMQKTLADMGLTEEVDPEAYEQQLQQMMGRLTQVEEKSKSFRTTGVQWAEKVLKIHEKRYNLHELEPDAFECGLITDSEFWHLDMLEDDFKVQLLNSKYCDYHKGPNKKYVSDGDYFLWFDFMSAGDIVNEYGRRMKEDDMLKLKDVYQKTTALLIPDQYKDRQGSYYDRTKSFREATDLNPVMNDAMLGQELAYNFMRSPNFDHNINIQPVDIFSGTPGNRGAAAGHPQMFRVMRLYWRSMKRIGWLTRIDRDGSIHPPEWVDENYRVTIEPTYDKSLRKEETKDNLLYGEHIDWTWTPEWRHVIKISPNQKHSYWMTANNSLDSIYIDGAPIPFQFKGRNNPFEALPPVEGCSYSYLNTEPNGFVDELRPLQILYNICMNKVPRKILNDYGNKLAVDRRLQESQNNSLSANAPSMDPAAMFEDKLRNSDIFDYHLSREALEGLGQPALPQVLQMGNIQESLFYLDAAEKIKWMAGEHVGITRQRLGGQKASETATGIQQGINYSETQTEKYFEQHSNLMQRVRQRMLDAAQFYSTFKESSQEVYQNTMRETAMLTIEGMENLLPHYNIYLETRANVRSALQTISQFLMNENTLPIKPSAKIEALIDSSIPKILSVIRESEDEQMYNEQQQAEADRQIQAAQIKSQQEQQAANLAHEDQQKELDRQRDIEVARIRALGGIQTDVDANGQTDASQNLDSMMKRQEISDKKRMHDDQLAQKAQTDTDKMLIEREKMRTDLEKERIKAEAAKFVAKENKNVRPAK